MSTLVDTDLLLIGRGSTPHKATFAELKGSLPADRTVRITAVDLTAADKNYVVVTADAKTITLPATPAAGARVTVVVAGDFKGVIVARNGQNIMGLAENLTLDKPYAGMDFTYVDATNGWRLS